MEDNEAKALAYLQEAEKKSKGGSGFFGRLMGGSKKRQKACDLYQKAGNRFKISKKWNEAGNCFVKSAELNVKKGDSKHAANNYADAANCFKKTNPLCAVDCLQKGHFEMAAKHHTNIAKLYETECPDMQQAMFHHEKAGDYYEGEENTYGANNCFLNVAQCAAQLENYEKAIKIYEEAGFSALDNDSKYRATEYFFKGLLCHLCFDLLNAQLAVKRYKEIHPAFADSREYKLVKDLILCVEDQNVDKYTETVKAYDKIWQVGKFTTTLLLRIKKYCGEEEDGDLR